MAFWKDEAKHYKESEKTLAQRLMESKVAYRFSTDNTDRAVLFTALLGNIPDNTMLHLLSLPLSEVTQMTREELIALDGITALKATRLMAAINFHQELLKEKQESRPVISSPDDVAKLLRQEMEYLQQEHFRVMLLNTKNHVLKVETITIGTLDSSIVHPRELFRTAIKNNAASIIIVHNHPSGDPTPSREDIEITKRFYKAGEIMGITLVDHVIIGSNGRFVSLKSKGVI